MTEIMSSEQIGPRKIESFFTPREKEVLSLMAQGLSNEGIIKQSNNNNVEFHARNIYSKLFESDPMKDKRSQAVLKYIEENPSFTNPLEKYHSLGKFTRREKEVLSLVGEGFSNTAISQKLFLTFKTTENHINNILSKMKTKIKIDYEKHNPRIMMVLAAKAIQKNFLSSDKF